MYVGVCRVCKIRGHPHNKKYGISGSILGPPLFMETVQALWHCGCGVCGVKDVGCMWVQGSGLWLWWMDSALRKERRKYQQLRRALNSGFEN